MWAAWAILAAGGRAVKALSSLLPGEALGGRSAGPEEKLGAMSYAVEPSQWYQAFHREVREARFADPLRESGLAGPLGTWTERLTGALIATCGAPSWVAIARGYAYTLA